MNQESRKVLVRSAAPHTITARELAAGRDCKGASIRIDERRRCNSKIMHKFSGRLLKVTEAAVLMGVGKSKVYDMLSRNELPQIRLGRRCVRIPEDELRGWIGAHTSSAA